MNISIGLLPLYLALYDEVAPEMRKEIDAFYLTIAEQLKERGCTVSTIPICRLENEFKQAVNQFEQDDVDSIVTLHMAYSPSLESIQPLLTTKLPLVVLNTTPDFSFSPEQEASRISFNHGIHGVQDMCSMLLRNKRNYFIESGHWQKSDVIDRVVKIVKTAAAADSFLGSKIGIIGEPFKGMGDFQISPEHLKRAYDIDIIQFQDGKSIKEISTDKDIDQELNHYRNFLDISDVPQETMQENAATSIILRDWVNEQKLDGFTCNFLSVNKKGAVKRVPFLFAAVGMYEGLGYAGEGDVLTAALVASLLKLNPLSTFTEIFCPDWENDRLFFSHMGELNPRICPETAKLLAKPYGYSDALPPVYTTGRYMAGKALLVNLVPLHPDHFRLIICPVTLHDEDDAPFENVVRGWMTSSLPISAFLTEYSKLGGTHHSGLIYDESVETLKRFGTQLGWDVQVIGDEN